MQDLFILDGLFCIVIVLDFLASTASGHLIQ